MSLKDEMKKVVKAKAASLLKLEEKTKVLEVAIDEGDINLFFLSMFGKDVMLKTKLIMSLQTTFGMSFYEQISKKLGEMVGFTVENQYKLTGFIPSDVTHYLYNTLEELQYSPNRLEEYKALEELYFLSKENNKIGDLIIMPDSTVDVFIKKPDGTEIFIDITTAKPNKKEFRTMKRKILTWYFMRLSHGNITPDKIQTYIAIPYNPESLTNNDYCRWSNYYDKDDLLVGDQLWRLVSNNQFTLNDMLDVFKELGNEIQAIK